MRKIQGTPPPSRILVATSKLEALTSSCSAPSIPVSLGQPIIATRECGLPHVHVIKFGDHEGLVSEIERIRRNEIGLDGGTPARGLEVGKDYMRLGKRAKRRLWVYGSLVTVLGGAYAYQPIRIDLVKREPAEPLPRIDPDSKRLFSKGTKVTVVVAHPDDPEFYVGGTLDQLGQAGADVTVLLITDGDKGYYPPGFTNAEENRRIRREEQARASSKYKANVLFLGERDGRLRSDERTTARVAAELQRLQPEYLMCFDDHYWPRASHGDHRHAGILTVAAAKQLPSIKWLMRFDTTAPNFARDITKSWDTKVCLIQEHASQFASKLEFITNMVRGFAEETGAEFGYEVAEGFRCTRLR